MSDDAFDGYADANPAPHVLQEDRTQAGLQNPKAGERVTPAELVTIAQLAERGLSLRAIGRALGRRPKTIARNLKTSRKLLQALAPDFAAHWHHASIKAAERGDHRPAMDALERLRVVEPLPKPEPAPQGPQFQVNIGLALPGLPSEQHLHTVKQIVPRAIEATDAKEPALLEVPNTPKA